MYLVKRKIVDEFWVWSFSRRYYQVCFMPGLAAKCSSMLPESRFNAGQFLLLIFDAHKYLLHLDYMPINACCIEILCPSMHAAHRFYSHQCFLHLDSMSTYANCA